METVGVRELRQNLSRYLTRVKAGESLTVTEHGREVARLSPSGPVDSPLARLAAERGSTMPRGDLRTVLSVRTVHGPPPGPPSLQVLEELREERL